MNKLSLKNTANDFTGLVLAFGLYQLILHCWFLFSANDPRLLLPTLVSFLHDLILLVLSGGFLQWTMDFFSGKYKSYLVKIFSVILIAEGTFLALYPKLLREYLIFPVNIFESDLSSAQTLISDYLGFKALIPPVIALCTGIIFYFLKPPVRISVKFKILFAVSGIFILAFSLQKPSPQPFIFSIQKSTENILSEKKRIVPSLNRNISKPVDANHLKLYGFSKKESLLYSNILLIVLEGQTATSFEDGFFAIKDGFYEQNKTHSVYYSNYYTSNLDSYTSLISMVTSVQVPYRAYADERLYEKVNSGPCITEDFKNRGFYTAFISCYEYQPFVPTRNYWDKIYERKDIEDTDKWITLGSSRMEMATEDKAAFTTIMEILRKNEKSFILHEMVYGHSPEWVATTGKSQNEYHNEYLLDLSNALKKENLWDKTLLVVVSDHGDRSKPAELENYRVPLLFTGQHIDPTTQIDSFLTHTELPRLINYYALNDTYPKSRQEIFLVGSTEKWVYGKALPNKENILIDDARGIELFKNGKLNATEVRSEFQEYLNTFNYKFGK